MARVRIGISGWRYAPWRKVFYPQDLPQRSELDYASHRFPAIEINGSFYSLQTPSSYGKWDKATPPDFQFTVKAPRYITHIKRLRDIEEALANFFASGVLRLGAKLGPVLWQFPPSFRYDRDRFAAFFEQLPRTPKAAAKLAGHHGKALKAKAWLKAEGAAPLRHAVEVRHPSFETADFVALLREHQIALVVADTAGRWPLLEDVTADFMYLRLHGDEVLYTSGYTDAALDRWAAKIAAWREGKLPGQTRTVGDAKAAPKGKRDIYAFFDNDVKVHAPYDALKLAHRLGLGPSPVEPDFGKKVIPGPRMLRSRKKRNQSAAAI